jgi:hypothetical protein
MTAVENSQAALTAIYTEIADFLISRPTLEQITTFRLSDESEQFVSDLLEANRTVGLTPDQREMLEDYSQIDYLMQFVKVRAFVKLDQTKHDVHS